MELTRNRESDNSLSLVIAEKILPLRIFQFPAIFVTYFRFMSYVSYWIRSEWRCTATSNSTLALGVQEMWSNCETFRISSEKSLPTITRDLARKKKKRLITRIAGVSHIRSEHNALIKQRPICSFCCCKKYFSAERRREWIDKETNESVKCIASIDNNNWPSN